MMKYLTVAVFISLSSIGLADIAQVLNIFIWKLDYHIIGQVKYLGGITFLLKDRCPDNADSARVERYEQCAANEILHVRWTIIIWKYSNLILILFLDPVCNRQSENWWQADSSSVHWHLQCSLLGRKCGKHPWLSIQWQEVGWEGSGRKSEGGSSSCRQISRINMSSILFFIFDVHNAVSNIKWINVET